MSIYNHLTQANYVFNIVLSLDYTDVSSIYRIILGRHKTKMETAANNWKIKYGN